MLHIVKPAALASRRASVFVDWQVSGAEDNPARYVRQAIRADLIGSDICTAFGITSRSSSPVLALCSIALQYGVPVEVIRNALSRDAQGKASSPLGAALDRLAVRP